MSYLSELNTKKQYKARVKQTHRLTPTNKEEIREIILEVEDPSFKCKVDQSFGVLVKHSSDFGNEYHHRLYSVADLPATENGHTKITMLVKRCSYVDEFSGELYHGVSSNYLCDRRVGDEITITGPFELPFKVPEDKNANMILIGMGTGIAPFRAFIKHIYSQEKEWKGKIRLFYGAKSGLELLYLNDKDGDLTNYYDKATFEAFHALSPRPHWNDPILLDKAIESRAEEILEMLSSANTYIYIAGYEKVKENLNKAFINIMGSKEKWENRKAELIAGKKWAEVIY
ncbi:ferredoxin-NADP reductase [Cecembia calidifontis]|jgi:ferredoxin--NADP+ reductase|uniref:Ferredoxin--NADP+ reductase n=1 Tax=Cecembia calidifontis TaxID=1187080 RepID=A0A4V2F6J2_9BACT|nr:ferredoxin-NADP reductase [Cecembia calidifontis]RZS96509.1 ferredoxin--NADP+ reductase [Cecembia calidifontis]